MKLNIQIIQVESVELAWCIWSPCKTDDFPIHEIIFRYNQKKREIKRILSL